MNDAVFWGILSLLDFEAEDLDAVIEPAVEALSAMAVADIEQFEEILAEKLFALDTREHARAVYAGELDPDDGDAYISADDFLYARCGTLVSGRAAYEAARNDPHRMVADASFEWVTYVATQAHERKTGEEMDFAAAVSYESFSNTRGWEPTAASKPGWATSDGVPAGNRRPG